MALQIIDTWVSLMYGGTHCIIYIPTIEEHSEIIYFQIEPYRWDHLFIEEFLTALICELLRKNEQINTKLK